MKSKISKRPSEYVKNNVLVTTSGNCFEPAFMCTYQALGIDRILLATEYPYEDSNECVQSLEGLPIPQQDRDKICLRNAGQTGITGSLSPNSGD